MRNFTYKQSFEHSIKVRRFDNFFFNFCTFQVVLNNCEVEFHKIEVCVNKQFIIHVHVCMNYILKNEFTFPLIRKLINDYLTA